MNTPDSADSRVGTAFGPYEIVSLIGQGGMGEVYEANDTVKGRTVALKILPQHLSRDESFKARFRRESRAAAILQAPNVIPIHDWGDIDGALYIDMRLVRGQTLRQMLAHGPLSPERAVNIMGQVAAALDAAHAAGLVHRDVKPENVIVTTDDFPYLVDFGIASAKGEAGLTMTGTQVGTMNYMAPERFSGAESTPAVDVYSLACVLYECLTGDVPYPAKRLEQAIAGHMASPVPRASAVNPAVPMAMDDVVARGMAKDPDDRYGSTGALARAARRAIDARMPAPRPVITEQTATGLAPTMQSWEVAARATPPAPSYPPPATPPPGWSNPSAPGPTPAPGNSRKWFIPIAFAAIAALLVVTIGVVIGLVSSQGGGNGTATSTSSSLARVPSTVYKKAPPESGPSTPPSAPAPTETPLSVGAPPRLVTGRDTSEFGDYCDGGYTLNNQSGPGTHSGRGSGDTSCRFTQNVLEAYWNTYGNATREPRHVVAPGTVSCPTVMPGGNGCQGNDFLMQCVGYPGDAFITCRGGKNAIVYLF